MKYYVIAGEASGDLHGSNLLTAIQKQQPNASFRCWGGDLMMAAGGHVVKHYRELAFMGFAEVIMNLGTILKNLSFCKADIDAYQPDAIILIDYPGFNLRIAEWAKQKGYKVIYYISPQVWAWKANRVKKMRKCIDLMMVILPFETQYFKSVWQWDVQYVGHPLVEVVDAAQQATESFPVFEKPIIAILPGSRKQEIKMKLPIMLAVAQHFPNYQFVVAQAPGLTDAFFQPFLAPYPNVAAVVNQTYPLLKRAKAALVTSGTATLETALFKVPEVVCYKGNPISFAIAKAVIKIKYISLVNLIMDKPVIKELIQHDLTVPNLTQELKALLEEEEKRKVLFADYHQLHEVLSAGGHASNNAATTLLQFLANSRQ